MRRLTAVSWRGTLAGFSQRNACTVALSQRGVIQVSGEDATKLLQGLITNDMAVLAAKAAPAALPAAFLNSKGRVMAEVLIVSTLTAHGGAPPSPQGYLLDCARASVPALIRHLKLYKLRSKATIRDCSGDYQVVVAGFNPLPVGLVGAANAAAAAAAAGVDAMQQAAPAPFVVDPRCAALGARALVPAAERGWLPEGMESASEAQFEDLRLACAVAEGREMAELVPHECNLDLLGLVSFTKGCYLGQELTARTQFKGVVRKRLLPFLYGPVVEGLPPSEAATLLAACAEAAAAAAGAALSAPFAHCPAGAEPPGASAAGPALAPGAAIIDAAGASAGTVVAVAKGAPVGIGMFRLERVLGRRTAAVATGKGAGLLAMMPAGQDTAGQKGEAWSVSVVPYVPPWWPPVFDAAIGKVSM